MKFRSITALFLIGLFSANMSFGQSMDITTMDIAPMDIASMFDKAMNMQEKGDKGFGDALSAATGALETEANASKTDFAPQLLSQVGLLKKMLPLASTGMVKQGPLQKIISTVKLLLGANKLRGILGGGSSLVGQASALADNLGLIKMGMTALGSGSQQDKLGSLISSAMGNVDLLGQGGLMAKKAEPTVKTQLGGILNMTKGMF